MTSKSNGRIFRRKDGKYLIYIPKNLAEDSNFPFKIQSALKVEIFFNPGKEELIIKKIQ